MKVSEEFSRKNLEKYIELQKKSNLSLDIQQRNACGSVQFLKKQRLKFVVL